MNQTKLRLSSFCCTALLLTLAISCSKPNTPNTSNNTTSVPVLTTSTASTLTQTSAQSGGVISSDGGTAVTARGVCWNTSQSPTTGNNKTTDGSGNGNFTSSLTGLSPNTSYYVRAYATNSAGTAYGNEISFTSLQTIGIPVLTTITASNITQITAQTGGTISSDGGATVTARGVCWSTTQNPTITNSKTIDGIGTGTFASSLTGLTKNTTYYIRAYATNSIGTGYGNSINFATLQPSTVTDYDGNVYATVTIGSQIWMAENLRNTHYQNGSPVTFVTNSYFWGSTPTGAYCNYNNDVNNAISYGHLYSGGAAFVAMNVCPVGWHVPTTIDINILKNYLNSSTDGGQLKETGTTRWLSPNTGATNVTGFSGRPGGYRALVSTGNPANPTIGTDFSIQSLGSWWYYDTNSGTAQTFSLNYNTASLTISTSLPTSILNNGYSIRCVKN